MNDGVLESEDDSLIHRHSRIGAPLDHRSVIHEGFVVGQQLAEHRPVDTGRLPGVAVDDDRS